MLKVKSNRICILNIIIKTINCLHLPIFRPYSTKVSGKSNVSTFPIEKPRQQYLTLHLLGEDQPKVMVYKNNNRPESPMLHSKFH